MIIKGDDIKQLIPQRAPFMMVDEFEQQDENTAQTVLTVSRGNYFLLPDSMMSPTGLIEHIAQSCSALAGYQALSKASLNGESLEEAPVGLIGEVKHFKCLRRPQTGERVQSNISFDMTFGNVTVATGQAFVDEELIAEIKLKIFIQ